MHGQTYTGTPKIQPNGGRKLSQKKKKTHEYCSENAEVSGGNFLISHEEDKTQRGEKTKR